ncbi:response regulator [Erythrobacteraceae bacterium CFH 75059]|uniref:response regulator n=1 Tax=Qipengyuania thermophila TaxID=2509361 RepID=UPI00101F9262|nr:response regulator [Qipengyuania thermophila]TCD06792.1 response regulator [Erythrobacteraceae bacterium CFH 75059]
MTATERGQAAGEHPGGELPQRVLLVEDDPVLALDIMTTLQEAGVAAIEHCSTTEAALASLRGEQPDLVILDVHLTDRDDGWAIAELVSQMLPTAPRIIFSTAAPDEIPPFIAELGPVLEKPYDPTDLVALIRTPARRGIIWRLKQAMR